MTACTICPDRLLRPLLPLAFWLVVWQLAALAVGQSFILPGPAAVLGTLIQLAGVPSFWQTALLSLVRVLAGLLAGQDVDVLICGGIGGGAQNALAQAKQFAEVANVNGIILTKLDGTAKGGIAVAIQSELDIPVKYIGVGETIDDLQKFDADAFVNALFDIDEKGLHTEE